MGTISENKLLHGNHLEVYFEFVKLFQNKSLPRTDNRSLILMFKISVTLIGTVVPIIGIMSIVTALPQPQPNST